MCERKGNISKIIYNVWIVGQIGKIAVVNVEFSCLVKLSQVIIVL